MFTNADLNKLLETPGVPFITTYAHFKADKRLTDPFAISGCLDAIRQFSEYETYPYELAVVFYYNGF